MIISLGEPQGQRYYGGQIAAPIFKAIAEDIVQVSPTEKDLMRTKVDRGSAEITDN